jgi:Leucyl aminopeptidase
MQLELINKSTDKTKADILVSFITKEDIQTNKEAKLLSQAGFKAEQDTLCFLHEKALLACGIEKLDAASIRSAAAAAVKALKGSNYTSAKTQLSDMRFVNALVEGFVLGGYDFNFYRSEPKQVALETLFLACDGANFAEFEAAFNEAMVVAQATCFTRDIVNKAPQEINPETLALLAKNLRSRTTLSVLFWTKRVSKREYERYACRRSRFGAPKPADPSQLQTRKS